MNRLLEFFSGNYNTQYSTPYKNTNIIRHGTGYSHQGTTGIESMDLNIISYQEFIDLVERLKDYRNSELADTILDLYVDAVFANIDTTTQEYVRIKDNKAATKLVNDILENLNIVEFIKSNCKDFIYYGSYSSELTWDGRDFLVRELRNPFTTLETKEGNYIIQGEGHDKLINSTVRLSFNDIKLEYRLGNEDGINVEYDEFYVPDKGIIGRPLFASVEMKIKDYIMKDLIIAFLSLMKLLEQDTYTVDVQRLSDMDSVAELCENIKDLIVAKDDYQLLTGLTIDKGALLMRLFDNKRVIPSISSNLNSLSEFQPGKLDEKLRALREEKEVLRDEILTNIGFPRDLFAGSTNKWETTRQNDRYNLKITNIKEAVQRSIINIVMNICDLNNFKINKRDIHVLFVKASIAEINNLQNKIEANSNTLRAVSDIINSAGELLKLETIKDKSSIEGIIRTLLGNVNSELANTFDAKSIMADEEAANEDTGGSEDQETTEGDEYV